MTVDPSVFPRPPRPHQKDGVEDTVRLLNEGETSVCVTSPTGGGKSDMMVTMVNWALQEGLPGVSLFTNRKMLTEQLIETFKGHQVPFGVRAAGFNDHLDMFQPVQICSTQTENSRCYKSNRWQLHGAKLILVDEGHIQKAEMMATIMKDYLVKKDAAVICYTATPLGLSNVIPPDDDLEKRVYSNLVVAGTVSQLREQGSLLPCIVYAPDELDTSKIKPVQTGEYSLGDIRKKVWTPAILGRVFDHWKIYNPDAQPALLFAPGVAESKGFVDEFRSRGVRAAHIDGDNCYVDGEEYKSDRDARKQIIAEIKSGEIPIGCNRFVFREGIDIPELFQIILACPIGSLLSYVQVVGRVLRYHESLDKVIMQDHGGNWHRHGSPNMDRDWAYFFDKPVHMATDIRKERIREGIEPEPIHCPRCGMIRMGGDTCPPALGGCGFRATKRSRMVIQHDGTLKEVTGRVYKPRKRKSFPNTEAVWSRCYHRMKRKEGKTMRQVYGLFVHENGYHPPKDLPFMPKNEGDWFQKVKDVPESRLY